MDEMTNNVVEEVVTNENVQEVAVEAAKSFDWMQFGVKGLCIAGGIAIIGGITYGVKKGYDKIIKPWRAKKAADEELDDDFDDEIEDDVIDPREETDEKQDKEG